MKEEILKQCNNAEWSQNGDPLYTYDQVKSMLDKLENQILNSRPIGILSVYNGEIKNTPIEYVIKKDPQTDLTGSNAGTVNTKI